MKRATGVAKSTTQITIITPAIRKAQARATNSMILSFIFYLSLSKKVKNAEPGHRHQNNESPIDLAKVEFPKTFCIHPPELFFKSVSRPESFIFCHLSFPLLATKSVTFHFLFLLGAVVNGVVTACFGKFLGNRLFGGFLP